MQKLLVRHILDLMHREKNVCRSIFGTLLDIKDKSKDEKKFLNDLQQLGIKKSLWQEQKGKKKSSTSTTHYFKKGERDSLSCFVHIKSSRWI